MSKKFETKDPQLYKSCAGHLGPINSVCFSNDDKTLLSGSQDGSLMMWDLKKNSKSKVYKYVGHVRTIFLLFFIDHSIHFVICRVEQSLQ